MKGLDLFRGLCPAINGLANLSAVQIMTDANDHESQLASVANECQLKECRICESIAVVCLSGHSAAAGKIFRASEQLTFRLQSDDNQTASSQARDGGHMKALYKALAASAVGFAAIPGLAQSAAADPIVILAEFEPGLTTTDGAPVMIQPGEIALSGDQSQARLQAIESSRLEYGSLKFSFDGECEPAIELSFGLVNDLIYAQVDDDGEKRVTMTCYTELTTPRTIVKPAR